MSVFSGEDQPMHIKSKSTPTFVGSSGSTLYELIGQIAGGSNNYTMAYVTLEPNKSFTKHHHLQEECYYILDGFPIIEIDGQESIMNPHDCVAIPAGATHKLSNTSNSAINLLAFWMPSWTPKDSAIVTP